MCGKQEIAYAAHGSVIAPKMIGITLINVYLQMGSHASISNSVVHETCILESRMHCRLQALRIEECFDENGLYAQACILIFKCSQHSFRSLSVGV